ncbi:hypothetical protein Ahy_B04g070602 isoform K [Arachis hypogaea]|uniref:MULE transposase domain-containing protein n=1 Tax=Arachis hypogaea TaxID=3818 RepID=A0A444ZHX0_ARAHY|nr:hypothetical protein Ahy_B04g070602 isoform K [Arachis hypogaea]
MSNRDKAQMNSMKQFEIPTSKIMAYMAGQLGGYSMLRFTKRDLYNYVHSQQRARILDRDAGRDIPWEQVQETPGGVIWDNHHRQTCIFGFSLLQDEEVRTYRWVLLNLLDVMGQRTPNLVVTDGDKAMRTAIAEVMPSAKHRLCAWHLEKNCVQRVKEAEFWKVFKKAIYANFDVDEFERYWRTSIESLSLGQNTWVQLTYDIKESWATAYLRGSFDERIIYTLFGIVFSMFLVGSSYF